jgi:hypothetical protein
VSDPFATAKLTSVKAAVFASGVGKTVTLSNMTEFDVDDNICFVSNTCISLETLSSLHLLDEIEDTSTNLLSSLDRDKEIFLQSFEISAGSGYLRHSRQQSCRWSCDESDDT